MVKPEKPGQGLRELRLEKNFKQNFVAEKSGIHLKTYQRMEAGKTKIGLTDVPSLADAFGVPQDEILKKEGISMTNHFKNENGHNIGYVKTLSESEKASGLESRMLNMEAKLDSRDERLEKIEMLLEKVLSKLA